MIRLAFTTIMRSWRVSLLFILTITVFLVAGTALLNSVNLIQVQVEESLEKHGRGTYDILVRPAEKVNQVEKTFGLVEDNYLSSGDGRISITEWQEMADLLDRVFPFIAEPSAIAVGGSIDEEKPIDAIRVRVTGEGGYKENLIRKATLRPLDGMTK